MLNESRLTLFLVNTLWIYSRKHLCKHDGVRAKRAGGELQGPGGPGGQTQPSWWRGQGNAPSKMLKVTSKKF